MHTSHRISKFYEDLEKLDLRFPGKELSKRLKVSKGYVSEVLSKKKEPSEEFINDFYAEFKKEFSNGSQVVIPINNYDLPVGGLKVTLSDYMNLLKEQNAKAEKDKGELLDIIKNNLTKLLEVSLHLSSNLAEVKLDTSLGLAYQRTWVEYTAEQAAEKEISLPERKKKKDQVVLHMNKLLRSQIDGGHKEGKHSDAHRQHKEGQ